MVLVLKTITLPGGDEITLNFQPQGGVITKSVDPQSERISIH